ncbi:MAG: hypothetical protein IT443_04145 [Phycisphaeraceae bacterium]|nr:hypothetical protein [Phycisphaeraceae bacterium]
MNSSAQLTVYHQLAESLARLILSPAFAQLPPLSTPTIDLGLPAARLLLRHVAGQSIDPAEVGALRSAVVHLAACAQSDPPSTFLTDASTHRRPEYYALVLHLTLSASRECHLPLDQTFADLLTQALAPMLARLVPPATGAPNPADALWSALCVYEHALLFGLPDRLELCRQAVDAVLKRPLPQSSPASRHGGLLPLGPAPLSPAWKCGADSITPASLATSGAATTSGGGLTSGGGGVESLDAWCYRELLSLHALFNLWAIDQNAAWLNRIESACLYHLENTEPDNVTTQPWALGAFLLSAHTAEFAGRQLHNCLAQGDPSGPSALLLTDVVARLRR